MYHLLDQSETCQKLAPSCNPHILLTFYSPMKISFHKSHTQVDRVCLLGGGNHAPVRDLPIQHTSLLQYALFVKGIYFLIVATEVGLIGQLKTCDKSIRYIAALLRGLKLLLCSLC